MLGGVVFWWWGRGAVTASPFRTASVKRGNVESTISATGTVEPEEVVDVGAQVAGLIDYFGKDPNKPGKFIDYGTEVTEGMVLAHIDESLYAADAASAQASIDQANANVLRAQADLLQMRAKLVEAQRDWDRAQKIGPSDALSQNDYDMYQANFETAKANVAVDEAAVKQAQASVVQAQAEARKSEKNLTYCTIVSPVSGVIIDRRVNIGQTVVSSLSAPSLFLLAKDLKKMQVWASVNEADVGNVYAGQPVVFTVDAFPGQSFYGTVAKVRYNASMTQNVVTYTVEINTDNSNLKLLPYLTANVQFEIAKRHDVLLVPSSALRWTPQEEEVDPDIRAQQARDSEDAQRRGDHGGSDATTESDDETDSAQPSTQPSKEHQSVHYDRGFVWVPEGKFVRPVEVLAGVSDGANTEIVVKDADQLADGAKVIVGDAVSDSGQGAGANPFVPQFGKIFGKRH
jgi:HlyD family secretion protein